MIKYLFSFILLATFPILANAQSYSTNYNATRQSQSSKNNSSSANLAHPNVYQQGYSKSDGNYVNGHYKTQPNNSNLDNFSTSGNLNPYTQQSGSRAQDYSPEAANYGSGQTIHTGPRGGQYYINGNGNKTYVPKQPKSNYPF